MGARTSGGASRGSGSKPALKSGGSSSNTTTKNDRYLVRQPEGWAVETPNASKSSSVDKTQADAGKKATAVVGNFGGGEVRIQGSDGKWRDGDTVAPGSDSCPPKDKR